VGYRSDVVFAAAFRRIVGCSRGSLTVAARRSAIAANEVAAAAFDQVDREAGDTSATPDVQAVG